MDYAILMELSSGLGSQLAMAGAETYRVEESITHILAAYGLEARVYAVPNSLIVTIMIPGGPPMTQLSRIGQRVNDLDAVERYSNLSRRICSEKPDPAVAMQWLKETSHRRKHYRLPMILFGNMLVAWGFCIFFGGSLADSLCATVCGLLLGLVDHFLGKIQTNVFFKKIAAAFVMAFAAYGISATGMISNVDTAVIGTLMLLVPGLLFTNALRDIIFGDTNSGINRVVEVLLIAAAVALGTAAAWELSAGLWGAPQLLPALAHSPWVTCAVSFVACVGFVIVFNIHGYGNLLCALGGSITWGVYCLAQYFGCSPLLCCFIATVIAAVFSEVMARIRRYPAISYLVISLLPLIPGAGIYYTAQQAVQQSLSGFLTYGTNTLATAGVMAVGILIVSTAVRFWHYHPKTERR